MRTKVNKAAIHSAMDNVKEAKQDLWLLRERVSESQYELVKLVIENEIHLMFPDVLKVNTSLLAKVMDHVGTTSIDPVEKARYEQ